MKYPVICIAEKPSQLRAYANTFNAKKIDNYYVVEPCKSFEKGCLLISAIGHLLDLQEVHAYPGKEHLKVWDLKHIPMDLPLFLEYQPSKQEGIAQQLNTIKKVIRTTIQQHGISNVTVINCTDIDGEGSAIFYNIIKYCVTEEEFNRLTIKRLWINSLESKEIYSGFNNLQSNEKDYRMYLGAMTRAMSDFYTGINLSRVATLYGREIINILLQQRAKKNGTTPKRYEDFFDRNAIAVGRVMSCVAYMVYMREEEIANFTPETFYEITADFKVANGTYIGKVEGFKTFDQGELIKKLKQHRLIDGSQLNGQINSVEKEIKNNKAPKLHSLTTLQVAANKKWKFSAQRTLATVQSLYEKKLLTYPRSDSNFLTTNEFTYLLENLEKYKEFIGIAFPNAYTEPRKQYVDNQAVQEHHAITLTRNVPNNEALSADEQKIYLEVMRRTLAMFAPDYQYEQTTIITTVNQLDFKTVGKVEVDKGFKQLWHSEASHEEEESDDQEETQPLPAVREGETPLANIHSKTGTTTPPSYYTEGTLVSAMENVSKLSEDEENAAILKEVEGIGTVATRGETLEKLKRTAFIRVEKNKVRSNPKSYVLAKIIDGTVLSKPDMTAKWEKVLKQIVSGEREPESFLKRNREFVGFAKDKFYQNIINQNTLNYYNQLLDDMEESQKDTVCPKCKTGQIRKIESSNGVFYGCSNYASEHAKCAFVIPGQFNNHKFTTSQIRLLLKKGKTSPIQFKTKENKPYRAHVFINSSYKLELEFAKSKPKSKKARS